MQHYVKKLGGKKYWRKSRSVRVFVFGFGQALCLMAYLISSIIAKRSKPSGKVLDARWDKNCDSIFFEHWEGAAIGIGNVLLWYSIINEL